jgi:hypothetical protein
MSTWQLTFITDAQIDLNDGTDVETAPITDVDTLPAGARIKINAVMPASGYLYAILLDQDDKDVTVLYPADNGTRSVSRGDNVKLADSDAWLTTPVAGQLRLAVSATPVTASEWALLPGRDGNAQVPRNSDG